MAKTIAVMKFGGTSVATAESRGRVVNHIRRTRAEGANPVVVVSAMGRRGAPYATDTLLDLLHTEGEPVDGRDEDLIFHCGEIISAALMSHLLKLSGLPAVGLTGGQARIWTDGRWRRAKIVRIDPCRILGHVEHGEIPVITGGQGVTQDEGEVTILGRGASDTSGVAVGVALGADRVEIYTDVPGVAVADPRVVPHACFLPKISYRKMYEMGVFGARVMHPGAVLLGQRGGLPVVCRSTFDDLPGTVIADTEDESSLVGIPSLGPVELLVVRDAPVGSLNQEDLYDRFAAVAMRSREADTAIVAVARDWQEPLEEDLIACGARVERLMSGRSLVSLVGSPDRIQAAFARAGSLLEHTGIDVAFQEQAEIRCTFAVPYEETSRAVRALYDSFAS